MSIVGGVEVVRSFPSSEVLQRAILPIAIAIVVFVAAFRLLGGVIDPVGLGTALPGILALGLLFYWTYRTLLWWLSRRAHRRELLPYQQAIYDIVEGSAQGRFRHLGQALGFWRQGEAPSATRKTLLCETLLFSLQSHVGSGVTGPDPWIDSVRRLNSEVHARWQSALLLLVEALYFLFFPPAGYPIPAALLIPGLFALGFLVFRSGTQLDRISNTKNLFFVQKNRDKLLDMLSLLPSGMPMPAPQGAPR